VNITVTDTVSGPSGRPSARLANADSSAEGGSMGRGRYQSTTPAQIETTARSRRPIP
jgi:hypothetical protein